jgi:hypothetical protein
LCAVLTALEILINNKKFKGENYRQAAKKIPVGRGLEHPSAFEHILS